GKATRVVLPREARSGTEHEIAALPAEPPDDATGLTVELVDGVRVPCGDEEVAVLVDVDRVHMEVVVGEIPSARLLRVRLGEGDVLSCVPVEQGTVSAQVEF